MIFKIIVEKDESGYYVGEVPALPGCFSQGKTIEELKRNIAEAIEGWLEVMRTWNRYFKEVNQTSWVECR
ncbi:type II toxin-antitoxin system HicB family antitoxin [bacterium]|nr:type II toxin-antitoxin system HicB family antitoxin [Candidatus Atribacteria bacterium]MBU4562911.1 type II toxin-antitoxin system HicB family antitoxin [bacterium]